MRDYSRRLAGNVKVEGKPDWSYTEIWASLTPHYLSVPRLRTASDQFHSSGPHFHIDCFRLTFLMNAFYFARKRELLFSFQGDYLGHINSCEGRSAVDSGTGTFPIVKADISVILNDQNISFSIKGSCTKGIASTFDFNKSPDWLPNFDISFSVPDEDLLGFLGSAGNMEGFIRSRANALNGY